MPTRYHRHPHTAGRIVEGQAYVVTAENSKMLTLNSTATLLWQLAEGGCTADQAVRAMLDAFEVEEETARADIAACLDDLVSRHVLVSRT